MSTQTSNIKPINKHSKYYQIQTTTNSNHKLQPYKIANTAPTKFQQTNKTPNIKQVHQNPQINKHHQINKVSNT